MLLRPAQFEIGVRNSGDSGIGHQLVHLRLPEEGQAEIMIFEDPAGGEEATLAALRKTLAAILALG